MNGHDNITMNQFIITQLGGDEKEFIQKPPPLCAGKRRDIIWSVGRKGLRRTPRNIVQKRGDCMSDFEMISIYLMILSLVVVLLKKEK